MIETLITSSVLILAICLIRVSFKGKIRPMVQYSLWGLVMVRLMIPWFYPLNQVISRLTSSLSVMNVADQVKTQVIDNSPAAALAENITHGIVRTYDTPVSPLEQAAEIDWQLVIVSVWVLGAALLAAWFFAANIRFANSLKQNRSFLFTVGTVLPKTGHFSRIPDDFLKIPVYETEELSSPCYVCYVGDRAIYLPKGAAEEKEPASKQRLIHMLTHELCHARHRDEIWGILRIGLLCYYWINPLVWAAAVLSKKDCELACDEAAVELLGEKERIPYGRTLLFVLEHKSGNNGFFYAGATIESGGRTMKERMKTLVSRKRYSAAAAAVFAACVTILAACTFTGSKQEETVEDKNPSAFSDTASYTETEYAETEYAETEFQHTDGKEQPESVSSIPAANYLEIIEERNVGEYISLRLLLREGGTGKTTAIPSAASNPTNRFFVEIDMFDKEETKLKNPEFSWGYGEDNPYFEFHYWNEGGKAAEIFIHAGWDGMQRYELRYPVKESEMLRELPLDLEITGINGENVTLSMAEIYSNGVVLHLTGTEKDLTQFDSNNVPLLKMKGEEQTENYPGPIDGIKRENEYKYLFRLPEGNSDEIEAVVCGIGGKRESYAVTPVNIKVR